MAWIFGHMKIHVPEIDAFEPVRVLRTGERPRCAAFENENLPLKTDSAAWGPGSAENRRPAL